VLIHPAAPQLSENSLLSAATQAIRERLPPFADNVAIVPVQGVDIPDLKTRTGDRLRLEPQLARGVSPLGLLRVPVNILLNGEEHGSVPVYLNVSYVQRASAAEMQAEADNPMLVKCHDTVKLVAHVGSIRLVAVGEALQEGRRGEMVRARNVDSGKMVAGRVADAQVIEVDY
jgi:hypothetical protein